jgi:hypothetical protein
MGVVSEYVVMQIAKQVDIAFRLYGIEGEDRRAIEEGVATPTPSDEETEESEDDS